MSLPAAADGAGTRPLAILGGTFDPVHFGHLRIAWEAAEALDAEVRLLPCKNPPHRPPPVASAEQRVALLRSALKGQGRLALDLRELRRSGPSYSIDTMIELRASIGSERPLVLLLGADAFAGLAEWHRWEELFDCAHIGVLTRPGKNPQPDQKLHDAYCRRRSNNALDLRLEPAGRIAVIRVSALEISSSMIRALLANRRQPRYLMPEDILREPALLEPYLPACDNSG